MKFTATIKSAGKTATGIEVPPEVVEALGSTKRPPVVVTINGSSYRTTIGVMGGAFMIPVSAENRKLTGVAAGDEVEVTLELDDQPRVVEVPADLATALAAEPTAAAAFEALSYSNKSRHVLSVTGAKTDETRQRRIAKVVAELS